MNGASAALANFPQSNVIIAASRRLTKPYALAEARGMTSLWFAASDMCSVKMAGGRLPLVSNQIL